MVVRNYRGSLQIQALRGFGISDQQPNTYFATALAGAGDMNGDGLADVIIGAPSINGGCASYVVFGKTSDIFVNTSTMGSGGFKIYYSGDTGMQCGSSVCSVKDVNGDGRDDVIVSAPAANSLDGITYVVFGKSSSTDIDLSTLTPSQGFQITGTGAKSWSGAVVAAAGDVNGDGLSDMLIGAPSFYTHCGAVYVVFGNTSISDLSLGDLGPHGFAITCTAAKDATGLRASGAGDVNGDGLADVIVGVKAETGGSAYVVFGKASTTPVSLASLDGDGFMMAVSSGSGVLFAGEGVDTAGSIAGVNASDVLVLSVGTAFVVFGNTSCAQAGVLCTDPVDLTSLGASGYNVSGAFESLAFAGDVNHDGSGDFVVSTGSASNNPGVSGAVIFGAHRPGPVAITATGVVPPTAGFAFGVAGMGSAHCSIVAGAGDVNGDGLPDLLCGSSLETNTVGTAYVLFAPEPSLTPSPSATRAPPSPSPSVMSIGSVNPVPGAISVALDSVISVQFSLAMDEVATQAAFALVTGGQGAAGTFSWADGGDALQFAPSQSLRPSVTYTVSVGNGALSLSGAHLNAPYMSSFTTASCGALMSPSTAGGCVYGWAFYLIVVGLAVVAVIAKIAFCVWWCRRKRRRDDKEAAPLTGETDASSWRAWRRNSTQSRPMAAPRTTSRMTPSTPQSTLHSLSDMALAERSLAERGPIAARPRTGDLESRTGSAHTRLASPTSTVYEGPVGSINYDNPRIDMVPNGRDTVSRDSLGAAYLLAEGQCLGMVRDIATLADAIRTMASRVRANKARAGALSDRVQATAAALTEMGARLAAHTELGDEEELWVLKDLLELVRSAVMRAHETIEGWANFSSGSLLPRQFLGKLRRSLVGPTFAEEFADAGRELAERLEALGPMRGFTRDGLPLLAYEAWETQDEELTAEDKRQLPLQLAKIIPTAKDLQDALIASGTTMSQFQQALKRHGIDTRQLGELVVGLEMRERQSRAHMIEFADIEVERVIGEGSFGTVYKAKWGSVEVAVKAFRCAVLDGRDLRTFEEEVSIATVVRHPNIITTFGACFPPDPPCIVMAFAPRSLYNAIADGLTWQEKVKIVHGLGSALAFLHRRNPPLLHRDIKSHNVLLAADGAAMLCDFGLAKHKQMMTSTGSAVHLPERSSGTRAWAAPELLSYPQVYSTKSDIYALGMVMYELASGRTPYDDITSPDLLLAVIARGTRPEPAADEWGAPPGYVGLMTHCWAHSPDDRPSAAEVVNATRALMASDDG